MRFKREKGVSLLELMLVFAIIASMAVFGLRLYSQYRFQLQESQLLANINQLFQAANNFYWANCRLTLDESGASASTGLLDPTMISANTYNLSLTNNLILKGFLDSQSWKPLNPLVDTPAPNKDKNYYVQFNRVIDPVTTTDPTMNAKACVGSTNPPSCDVTKGAALDPSQTPGALSSVSVKWNVQVAVKLSTKLTKAQWTQIKNDLGAQCISSLSLTSVLPCVPTPAENGFVVWQRSISYLNPDISSDLWISEHNLRQFANQYTNDPMAGLSGVSKETYISSQAKNWYNAQNYLCGG